MPNWAIIVGAIGSIATASALAVLIWQVIINNNQLKINEEQQFGDMALRLHDEFYFKGKNNEIIRTIERGTLGIKAGNYNGFNPESTRIEFFEEEELDDYLGVIELVGVMLKKGCLDFDYIDLLFGNYIVRASKNKVIETYINTVRKETIPIVFEEFYTLAAELESKGKHAQAGLY